MVKAKPAEGTNPMNGARLILTGMRMGTSPPKRQMSSVICAKNISREIY